MALPDANNVHFNGRMSSESGRRPTKLARATGSAVRDARTRLRMSQKQLGEAIRVSARAISRWESGQNGLTSRNWARLVGGITERDAAAGAALEAELIRLHPTRGKRPPATVTPPPPDPAALERAVTTCADFLDVSPKRARAFMAEVLRALAASRCAVDDALALLAPAPAPVAPPPT